MNTLNGFQAIVLKEFMHLRRDPTTLVIALMIPMVQLTLFGFAINFDIRHISTMIVDTDRSAASRQYVETLRTTDYVQITKYGQTSHDAEDAIRCGDVQIAVIIPPNFGRLTSLSLAGPGLPPGRLRPQVKVLIDGSDSQVATQARFAFVKPSIGAVEPRFDFLYNPDMKTTTFIIPGLIGVILQLVTVSLTSFSLVREREMGTLEQLMVSPVGRLGLMLGKVLPYLCLAMVEVVLVLLLGRIVFDVRVAGSIWLLLLLSIPFGMATLSLGLMISTIAQNQAQALQYSLLVTMPSILMSGFLYPRETMPGVLYLFSFALPVTYYMEILRGIVVRGAGFADLWQDVAALLILGAILIAISTARFRKTLA